MLVLKIILAIIIFNVIVFIVENYNKFCQDKFNLKFIQISKFLKVGISCILFIIGYGWFTQKNSDPLNGLIIMLIAFLSLMYQLYINFKSTNLLHGFIGTSIQIISVPFFPLFFFYWFFSNKGRPDAVVEVEKGIFGTEKHKIYYKK